ncbi:MAG: PLP-dependent aminotransferase family protein [Nitriliruptorales bacterium]|nr:PLP-dependent aminotransferase family protein [Nitriliruptorales bacterium]
MLLIPPPWVLTVRFDTDPYLERYADRVQGMKASEIRALFSVVSRPEIVSFAGGMPATSALDLDAVEEVAREVIRDHGPEALQYGGGQGLESVREQLVGVMEHEGVPAHADDLIVTVGGQQGLELITKCFVNPGDVVVAEGPTYVGALGALQSHQADVRHVPMDGNGMEVELLDEVLDQVERDGATTKFVYTIPNHQNPAGVSMSVERRHQLAEIAERRDLVVLEDNPYGLLDFDGKTWPSLRELIPDRVVYVGTMSKTFAPGARLGWIAAPHPVRDKLVLLREAADLCPSNLSQMIIETWLSSQPWQEQVATFRDVYRERAEAMLAALEEEMPDEVGWTHPEGGFYVWMTLPPGVDTSDLLAKAIDHRVAFVPGRGFYGDGDGARQLRLCYSFPTPDRIREGVVRLGELLHEELELVRAVYGDDVPDSAEDGRGDPVAGHGG